MVYWLKAGQQALARSAMAEAVLQLRKGLEVLAALPDSLWRRQQELELQTALGPALVATRGWSGMEVNETLTRVRVLAEQLDRSEYLVPPLANQMTFHNGRGECRLALPLGEQIETIGRVRDDTAIQLLGRFLQGGTQFFLGEFVTARALLKRCMDLADPAQRTLGGKILSFDLYAATLSFLTVTLAYLGYIDQARSRMDEAMSEARRIRHGHTLALVLAHAASLDQFAGSPMTHTAELLALSTESSFPYYLSFALRFQGRSMIALGQAQEGLGLLKQAQAELCAIGCTIGVPILLMWLAEAHAMLGQSAEERDCLAEAAKLIETTDERAYEAEWHRVSGNLRTAAGDPSGAEQHYRQAIAVAERQSAKLFQLRASTSLARLWRDQGRRPEARDLLAPIYGWFTEGFDAPVLKEAKALLDELA